MHIDKICTGTVLGKYRNILCIIQLLQQFLLVCMSFLYHHPYYAWVKWTMQARGCGAVFSIIYRGFGSCTRLPLNCAQVDR